MTLMLFTMLSGLGALFMAYALVKFSGDSKPPKSNRKQTNNSILVRGCAAKIVAFRNAAAKKQEKIGELARIHR